MHPYMHTCVTYMNALVHAYTYVCIIELMHAFRHVQPLYALIHDMNDIHYIHKMHTLHALHTLQTMNACTHAYAHASNNMYTHNTHIHTYMHTCITDYIKSHHFVPHRITLHHMIYICTLQRITLYSNLTPLTCITKHITLHGMS